MVSPKDCALCWDTLCISVSLSLCHVSTVKLKRSFRNPFVMTRKNTQANGCGCRVLFTGSAIRIAVPRLFLQYQCRCRADGRNKPRGMASNIYIHPFARHSISSPYGDVSGPVTFQDDRSCGCTGPFQASDRHMARSAESRCHCRHSSPVCSSRQQHTAVLPDTNTLSKDGQHIDISSVSQCNNAEIDADNKGQHPYGQTCICVCACSWFLPLQQSEASECGYNKNERCMFMLTCLQFFDQHHGKEEHGKDGKRQRSTKYAHQLTARVCLLHSTSFARCTVFSCSIFSAKDLPQQQSPREQQQTYLQYPEMPFVN